MTQARPSLTFWSLLAIGFDSRNRGRPQPTLTWTHEVPLLPAGPASKYNPSPVAATVPHPRADQARLSERSREPPPWPWVGFHLLHRIFKQVLILSEHTRYVLRLFLPILRIVRYIVPRSHPPGAVCYGIRPRSVSDAISRAPLFCDPSQ